MAKKGIIRNKEGKGGFKDHPEHINNKGAHKKGTFKERLSRYDDMTIEEFLNRIPKGMKDMNNEDILNMNVEELAFRRFIMAVLDGEPWAIQEYTNRNWGKVKETRELQITPIAKHIPSQEEQKDLLAEYSVTKEIEHEEGEKCES